MIESTESSCPFCGASQRRASAPSRLGIGLLLGLGLASAISCDDKDDSETETSDGSTSDGSTSDASTTTGMSTTTMSSTTTTTTDATTSTTSTTGWDPSGNADAVTYGGADEDAEINERILDVKPPGVSVSDVNSAIGDNGTRDGVRSAD
ncbi:MAG: hypothetical protein IPK80_18795 [Nannocystis sp.]|nr:hypothetical protein [Nannocystis sp.]